MREHLHSVCDIPSNILEIQEKFTQLYENFDFSEFEKYDDKLHWFVDTY